MSKIKTTFLSAIMVLVIAGLMVGCATQESSSPTAYALAQKGSFEPAPTDGDDNGGPQDRDTDLYGQPLPPNEWPGIEDYPEMCDMIHFDYDKSEIKDEWEECLTAIADYLKANPDFKLIVEGHCDERGTQEYNIALGERRASSCADHLISQGLSADRITTRSWGEERPLVDESNEEAWAQNRRAEFYGMKRER